MMKLTAKLNGAGNMFDDSHFSKAAATKFKKHLAERMALRMKEQKLTLKESAERAGCDLDDIRSIRKADVWAFDIPDLIAIARRFGFGVRVDVAIPGLESPRLH